MAIHDELKSRRFSRGDLRPLANELPRKATWPKNKAFLLRKEREFAPEVEAALSMWISSGKWPAQVSQPAAMFLSLRLSNARMIALRLAVPVNFTPVQYLETPAGIDRDAVMHWLLFTSWEALGQLDWLADIGATHLSVRRRLA